MTFLVDDFDLKMGHIICFNAGWPSYPVNPGRPWKKSFAHFDLSYLGCHYVNLETVNNAETITIRRGTLWDEYDNKDPAHLPSFFIKNK